MENNATQIGKAYGLWYEANTLLVVQHDLTEFKIIGAKALPTFRLLVSMTISNNSNWN